MMQKSETGKQPASAEQELYDGNKQTEPEMEVGTSSKSASALSPSDANILDSPQLATSTALVRQEQQNRSVTVAEQSENGHVSASTVVSSPANGSDSAKSSRPNISPCYSRSDGCSSANDNPHHQHHPPVPLQIQQIDLASNLLIAIGSWDHSVYRYDLMVVRLTVDEDEEEDEDEDEDEEDDAEYSLDPNAIEGMGYDFTHIPRNYEAGN